MSDLLDTPEAARYLGGTSPISASTLAHWRVAGIGPAFVRVGRAIRYRRSDLDSWLAAQTRAPESAHSTDHMPQEAASGSDKEAQ